MTNKTLAEDYKARAKGRRKVLVYYIKEGLFADAVREAQEACELALKGVIRDAGHTVPMTHEVSKKLREIADDLPQTFQDNLDRICEISKNMRRDRELAFYGTEDITPSEFYEKSHADKAIAELDEILILI